MDTKKVEIKHDFYGWLRLMRNRKPEPTKYTGTKQARAAHYRKTRSIVAREPKKMWIIASPECKDELGILTGMSNN